jgi:hypothetical protein
MGQGGDNVHDTLRPSISPQITPKFPSINPFQLRGWLSGGRLGADTVEEDVVRLKQRWGGSEPGLGSRHRTHLQTRACGRHHAGAHHWATLISLVDAN